MNPGDCKAHRRGVDDLVKRLEHRYDSVFDGVHYQTDTECGELDVMAFRNGILNYYEYKSTHTSDNKRKAKQQIQRFAESHPHIKIRGIYVASRNNGKLYAQKVYTRLYSS